MLGNGDDTLASDVSDYVSGRLDPLAARDVERLAKADGRVAAAIIAAKAVHRRVVSRLQSSSDERWN